MIQRWSRALGALLALTLLSGCVAPANVAPTTTPTAPVRLTTHTESIAVPANAPGVHIAAYCRPGEQMIGGGFLATDAFEYDAAIVASYPSSASQWTAIAGSSAAFTLEAVAYCVTSGPALGIHIIQARTGAATCPTREVELGAGFDASAANAGATAYAICASQGGARGEGEATITANPDSSQHSYAPVSVTSQCPINQIAVADNVAQGNRLLGSVPAGPPYSGWFFTLGGDASVSLPVRCVTL